MTGTYNGKPFVLLDQVTRIEDDGLEWVMANVIKFSDGSVKYVWVDDPLLKFDFVGVEKEES